MNRSIYIEFIVKNTKMIRMPSVTHLNYLEDNCLLSHKIRLLEI